jgi:Ca2+-transporting ATPase
MAVRGQGIATVHATGPNSEIGRIGKALSTIEDAPTPLHAQTRRLARMFASFGLSLSLGIIVLYGITRGSWLKGVLAGITLAMAMLPEEFPLILTVFMVMGAWRISQQRVLTRRAASIETLGAATVLCTDKTGTLTLNRMSIAELEAEGRIWQPEQGALPETFHRLLEYGILASNRDPFDPMEKAFLQLGGKHLRGTEHIHRKWVLAHEYGLSTRMLAMSHVWKALDHEEYFIAMKGAPEAVADLCHMNPADLEKLRHSVERMAKRGMRVLGVAAASFDGEAWPGTQHDFDFKFLGLVGLADPLRPGVAEAIQECRAAGIKVAMITGDYPATAIAIAQQAGIDISSVVSGEGIETLNDEVLAARIRDVCIFARVTPEQKLRLVNAFRANGEVVAMTGDGVNDAPSLKSAHIGIAMGGRGTDVAREASSLVLLDDDFGSIVKAVRLGRRIYENIRKAMGFVLAVHVPIAGLSLFPLLFGLPVLFTPVHIAFLELVIDPVCSIVFEAEPEEDDVMQRPPRNQNEPLFSGAFMVMSVLQGLIVLLAVGALFVKLLHLNVPENAARAVGFIALVACNFGLVLVNRSNTSSLSTALRRSNRAFWTVLIIACALLSAALWVPTVRELFHFAAASTGNIAIAIGTGITVLMTLELMKAVKVPRRESCQKLK